MHEDGPTFRPKKGHTAELPESGTVIEIGRQSPDVHVRRLYDGEWTEFGTFDVTITVEINS